MGIVSPLIRAEEILDQLATATQVLHRFVAIFPGFCRGAAVSYPLGGGRRAATGILRPVPGCALGDPERRRRNSPVERGLVRAQQAMPRKVVPGPHGNACAIVDRIDHDHRIGLAEADAGGSA